MNRATERPFLVSGEHRSDMGMLVDVLHDTGREFEFVERTNAAEFVFAPAAFAGLIILGGGEKYWAPDPEYGGERALIATALQARKPILGLCLGAQLLAAHLLGRSDDKPLLRVGKRDLEKHHKKLLAVEVTDLGRADPVVRHFAPDVPVAQYHEDSFDEPPTATALAWSCGLAVTHCEAFRVGDPDDAVYGFQFHPEPTLEMLQAEGKRTRWFDIIPPVAELESAVAAGEAALRAWVSLATAR